MKFKAVQCLPGQRKGRAKQKARKTRDLPMSQCHRVLGRAKHGGRGVSRHQRYAQLFLREAGTQHERCGQHGAMTGGTLAFDTAKNRLHGVSGHAAPKHTKPVDGMPQFRAAQGIVVLFNRPYRIKRQTGGCNQTLKYRVGDDLNIMAAGL